MAENNPLKERCKKVLQMKNRADRRAEKSSFGIWIGDQKEDDLIIWVKTLSYNELKIAMNCGLHGKSMTTAMLRLDEYKDHRERIEREELTGEKPLSNGKPSLDVKQGLEQLDPDMTEQMIQNSEDEILATFNFMIEAEMNKRHPEPSPDVA